MRKLLPGIATLLLASATPAFGQAFVAPTPAPLVTAENADWFLFGEPVTLYGVEYIPAGPRVFFDANLMVRAGVYRGLPIYLDTTLEPYSIIFVPAAPNVMQPYERRRSGDMAGTTGSRPPSIPIEYPSDLMLDRAAQYARAGAVGFGTRGFGSAGGGMLGPEGNLGATQSASVGGVPTGRVVAMEAPLLPPAGTFTAAQAVVATRRGESGVYVAPRPGATGGDTVGTAGAPPQPRPAAAETQGPSPRAKATSGRSTVRIWIDCDGAQWFSAGRAMPVSEGRFRRIGDYRGHAVYSAADGKADTIYVESLPGWVAPFRK